MASSDASPLPPATPLPPSGHGGARWLSYAGAVLVVISIISFAAIQYGMPREVAGTNVLNIHGAWHYQRVWFGKELPPLEDDTFSMCFRASLLGAFIGYGMVVAGALLGGPLPRRLVIALVVALGVGLAVGCPASLSTDGYYAVEHARLKVVHGINPYFAEPDVRDEPRDSAMAFSPGYSPYPYGPILLIVQCGVIAVTPDADGCWFQLVGLNLLGAASLLGLALASRSVAERLRPGWGSVTLAAIGLNPLFLIEVAANGHNDALMLFLVMLAARQILDGHYYLGSLILGGAIGIKYVPITLLPWLIMEARHGLKLWPWLGRAVAMTLLALAPMVLAFLPFESTATRLVANLGHYRQFSVRGKALHEWEELGRARIVAAGVPETVADVLLAIPKHRGLVLVAIYAGLSVWLWRRPTPGLWLTTWGIFLLCLQSLGIAYPWYMIWPWSAVMTRWDKISIYLFTACLALGLLRMITLYARFA